MNRHETTLFLDVPADALEAIARVTHEANRAYCLTLGDTSHASWDDARSDLQASVIDGVRRIATGGVTTPGDSHANWRAFKLSQGWTLGPVKDADARTHPNLVPFDQLPVSEQTKDYLFYTIVTTLLTATALMQIVNDGVAPDAVKQQLSAELAERPIQQLSPAQLRSLEDPAGEMTGALDGRRPQLQPLDITDDRIVADPGDGSIASARMAQTPRGEDVEQVASLGPSIAAHAIHGSRNMRPGTPDPILMAESNTPTPREPGQ